CRECTITLEDVQLQLGLLVDGFAFTESVQSTDWGVVCYELFSVISNNIYGGQIEMGWLPNIFLEPGNDSTTVERIRYARAYILEMIRGYLMPDLSRNFVHLRWLLKLVDSRVAVISDELFQNLNIWHVKVPLVNYATVEMHQTDRVLQQFKF
ncbi:hypothetical protein Goshw_011371, partial [Gossypium schwendimanii]|nr:hypothetical protein [Gossypium schwendimanii]